MGHLSYLRRMPDDITYKQSTPFPHENRPGFFADHVNYYGSKFDSIYVSSVGLDRNWHNRIISMKENRLLLYYVVEGRCFFNGNAINAGQMLFVLPNIMYTISQDPESPAVAWWVTVKGNHLISFIEYCKFNSDWGIRLCERMNEITPHIENMVYYPHFGVSPEAVFSAELFHIISIQRYENSKYSQQYTIRNKYVFEALKYIEDHCMERLTVEDIASHIHISPKYLTNIFSKHASCSMREFIVQSKMNVAKNLLSKEQFTVQDVSDLLGYSDYYQFSKQFKKHFGKSPSQIKKKR